MAGKASYRLDIQALRGYAVFIVLLSHAGIGPFVSGHLGVDIFFVISGYLITSMLIGARAGGRPFHGFDFLYRRIRRLLPAAYLVLLLTLLAAPWMLGSLELKDFAGQILPVLAFYLNFHLWGSVDYFSLSAEMMPLLHYWSLAVEVQYYLFALIVFVVTPVRAYVPVLLGLCAASLVLFFWWGSSDPAAAFYMLPARIWEFLFGGLLAVVLARAPARQGGKVVGGVAVLLLLAVPMMPAGLYPASLNNFLVCLAATLFIFTGLTNRFFVSGPGWLVARLGEASYSVYLAHWPIMSFLYNASLGEPSVVLRITGVLLGLGAGLLIHGFFERPVRLAGERRSTFLVCAAIAGVLIYGVQSVWLSRFSGESSEFSYIRRINVGLDVTCEPTDSHELPAACVSAPQPKMLIWGDSFAMHWVTAIAGAADFGVAQATRSVCGPFSNQAPFSPGYNKDPEQWTRDCIELNEQVFQYIQDTPSLEVVAISSIYRQYLYPALSKSFSLHDGELIESPVGVEEALVALSQTLDRLHKLGKRVVLIAPPPSVGLDYSSCVERQLTGKLVLGRNDCAMDIETRRSYDERVLSFIEGARRLPVGIVDPAELLCDERRCVTHMENVMLYRDSGHMSYAGADYLVRKMGMVDALVERAR